MSERSVPSVPTTILEYIAGSFCHVSSMESPTRVDTHVDTHDAPCDRSGTVARMGDQLRVGFLGAGLIATYHSKSLRRSGAPVQRCGVFDADPARAASFAEASGHTVMASEDDVLDSCDAVYVCTWTSEHGRQVEKAAARRLAIFCEKPLAFDVAGGRAHGGAGRARRRRQPGRPRAAPIACLRLGEAPHRRPGAGTVMGVVFRDDQFIPSRATTGRRGAATARWRARARCSSTASTTSTCCASWWATSSGSAPTRPTSTGTTGSRMSPTATFRFDDGRARHAGQHLARQPGAPQPAPSRDLLLAPPHRDRG